MKQNNFYEVDGCTDFIPVKLIEEHKHMTNTLEVELTQTGYKTFVPIIYSFPKANEPQKPVVPKFVAEWIEELKKSHSNLAWVWQVYPNEPKVKNWLESNTEKFMRAWLDGFEIEQEQLYTVEFPTGHQLYKNYPNGGSAKQIVVKFANHADKDGHFTKRELEAAGLGWVFDCEGVKAKEVE